MKIINNALRFVVVATVLAGASYAQPGQPRQEKLLNGLKVVMWPDSSAGNVSIRIRVHAGAAFDPQGKEGVMKMLAENVFPTDAAREYFRDDLGGGLEVRTTYDYLEIRATGKPEAFLQMMETLAVAVANVNIDKETTAKLRTTLLESLKQLESDPAYVADRAISKRLFGTFPYGRPVFGTTASVSKIVFPDLIDAKQRFLTADNATVTVSGNFDRSIGFRAIRRLFGAWLKSDKRVPSTFRQPDPPPTGLQMVPSPSTEVSGLRFAAQGVARKDKDFAAANVFALILADRLKAKVPAEHANEVFVRCEARTLPGFFIIGIDAKRVAGREGKIDAGEILLAALAMPVTETEFQSARSRFAADWAKRETAEFWLDADTYGITNVDADIKTAENVSLSDVSAYAEKLRKAPMAAVFVNTQPAAN